MTSETPTHVSHAKWGRMEVTIAEDIFVFRDCKVWPGGAVEWDWRLTGTHHRPGTQPVDIEEILNQGVDVMVLSRGVWRFLGVCSETKELLRERGIQYHIEETTRAVALYNSLLKEGHRVGGIFHSTC